MQYTICIIIRKNQHKHVKYLRNFDSFFCQYDSKLSQKIALRIHPIKLATNRNLETFIRH